MMYLAIMTCTIAQTCVQYDGTQLNESRYIDALLTHHKS